MKSEIRLASASILTFYIPESSTLGFYSLTRVMARSAWEMLAESVYSCQTKQMGQVKSMMEVRPRLDLFSGFIPNSEFMPIRRHYKESKLVAAWHGLYEALEKQTGDMTVSGSDGFAPTTAALYDIADLTRQVLRHSAPLAEHCLFIGDFFEDLAFPSSRHHCSFFT